MKEEDVNEYAAGLCSRDMAELKFRQKELLDIIDGLRGLNINKYVELPQIIVVGDQSSGKSSVLEAITGVSFPSKGTVCTRFATELILREADETSMEVTLHAHESASEETKQRFSTFTRTQEELQDLSNIVTEATEFMSQDGPKGAFYKDILRIKVSGPNVLQLTLVDLPGFYHAESEDQPDEYRELVNDLAAEYMERESSIILAVVSAKSDPALQLVLNKTKLFDRTGQRTIGIITKPDQLEAGDLETKFFEILENNSKGGEYLKLGWHVLRNRSHGEPQDPAFMYQTEKRLFSTKRWARISDKVKGISTLRQKLVNTLLHHIASKLPTVISRIEDLVKERKASLKDLGDARTETRHYMRHLESIASKFTNLAEQAASGDERDTQFFGELNPGASPVNEARERNLRARVRLFNRQFVLMMQNCGSKRTIKWTDPRDKESWIPNEANGLEEALRVYGVERPAAISQEQLEKQMEQWALKSSGTELPGVYSEKLVFSLFEDQAQPWKGLAQRHIERVMDSARILAGDILQYVTGEDGRLRDNINRTFISPFFEERTEILENKLAELLPQHQKSGFPLALERIFLEKVKIRSYANLCRDVGKFKASRIDMDANLVNEIQNDQTLARDALNGHWKNSIYEWGLSRVLDCMVEYYGMTLETFMSNVIVLGVENQLMVQIPKIFTTSKIMQLSDQVLEDLAGESEEVKIRREELKEDLEMLEAGAKLCQQWRLKSNST